MSNGSPPLQQGEYLPLPDADTHCYDEDTGKDVWSHSAEQMRAYVDADRAAPAEDDKWRSLALQFDSHRMQALSHLKLLLECGEDHADAVRTFLAGPPLDGESVLAQRIAAYAQPAPVAEDADPLQGAANWLVTSHATTSATELGSRLCIGYNRAERLFDAARAQAAQPEGGA